VETETASIER